MNETTIQADFISSFKTGDNIRYNLSVLNTLYSQYNQTQSEFLLKPIILINASIIEAVLHDFYIRIRHNTREGVHSLAQDTIDYIRGKQIDEFEKYIAQAEKHDFFNMAQTQFYKKLDTLRKIRNRIHIQNNKGYTPKDENQVFTDTVKTLSEKLLEKTMKTMSERHYRSGVGNYVGEFVLPWNAHFA